MTKHVELCYVQHALSAQEREVAGQLAKLISSEREVFEMKNVRDKVEIEQHSHLSAIVTRLVKKGLLIRIERGKYKFTAVGLARCSQDLE